jgi:outer membrane receptor protein involved in Fe transport
MSFKRILCLSILFSVITFSGRAQSPVFTVKGVIVDEADGRPLEFATVAMKRVRDSSLVAGTITNATGEFRLNDVPPGGYNVEIAFIGYEKITQRLMLRPGTASPVTDMGKIKMKVSAKMLEAAEITAEKSFVMNNIDKKTYNTEQLAVTAGGNVKDVLDNIPSVEVDQDGNVSLRGNENVTILIDGRPSGMTGAGGKSLLESIPASAIENVEVITNPSAKYDPEGISGIINIITKKNKLQGFTGNIGANVSSNESYGGNFSLAYRKGKWNTYVNYGFNRRVSNNSGESYRETYFNDVTSILDQNEEEVDKGYNHNVKTGADFNLNDRNTISASALFNTGTGTEVENTIYRERLLSDPLDSIYKRNTSADELNRNVDFDLNWVHNFKQKGRKLNFLGTASFDNSTTDQVYDQLGYFSESVADWSTLELERDFSDNVNTIYTAGLDYEHPIGDDKKIESGYKTTIRSFDTDFRFEDFDQLQGGYINDTNRTNQFIYRDQLHALYAQYRQTIGKFGYQIGVRGEYSVTQSELVNTNETFDKDYPSLFPSAFLTYKPGEKSQVKATYSRRINRPRRGALNPFANYDDPQNIRKGNPFLDPEYTDSYELEYSRFIGKVSVTATGYARFTTDYIQRYRTVDTTGITTVTYENLNSQRNYGVEIILNGNPYKWMTFTLSGNFYRNELDASNLEDDLNSSAWAGSARAFTTFKLPYKTDLQLTYFYRPPMKLTQGTMKDMQMLTIAASIRVLKDKGTVSLRIADPFNTQRWGFEFEDELYIQDFTRKRESRIVTLSFTYRFGELRDSSRQRRDGMPRDEMNDDF